MRRLSLGSRLQMVVGEPAVWPRMGGGGGGKGEEAVVSSPGLI